MGRVPPLGSARFPWLATRAPQDSDFSGLELAGRFDGCIQQRDKVDHPIRDRSQDHDSDFMALEILLVLEILSEEARLSNSPFFKPIQPRSNTVSTVTPLK
jgi:hypothetical protein